MTKTNERLALVERQRRFEWDLAREMHTAAAGRFVAGKTHDLLNLVQIVQLATLELERRCTPESAEFIADLTKAAKDAQRQLTELMRVARPEEIIAPGAPVGAAILAAVETVRAVSAIEVDLHLTVHPDVTTRCSFAELEHLIYGLTLDAASAGEDPEIGPTTPVQLSSASARSMASRGSRSCAACPSASRRRASTSGRSRRSRQRMAASSRAVSGAAAAPSWWSRCR